jgi:hypothetical protein
MDKSSLVPDGWLGSRLSEGGVIKFAGREGYVTTHKANKYLQKKHNKTVGEKLVTAPRSLAYHLHIPEQNHA